MTTVLNKKQTYKDIFDGRSYQKVDGALFKNLDQGIKNELLEILSLRMMILLLMCI